ncbi:MAG: MATE family efflux transporter [Ignavibacteria bacterium GWB2_35_12]|nr:MAG: MATE family efflux transporter [Ignavibacteria bacterium GWB2_35_12]OGU90166.1 MAG: MATE family efflux transporter [Ignavibacteria bacterium RIFOXYA2_FULL_35_10]OGV21900.1 MAG: MATE family efflux transporter [Ignavibacteria bacterium RIFOXYC2_FULL_35_21]
MQHTERLGKEKIGKLLWDFSVPAIIGMIVMASYNVIDRIFVGRGVGPLALSAISISFPLIIVVIAFGMLIGIGATALVSIKLGEGKKEEAEKVAGNGLTLAIIISLALTALGYIFLDPLIRMLGATGQVFHYAKDFIGIALFGIVFQGIAFTMNNIIRGEGNPKIAMLTMVISAVINTILNPIFIFGFHWGVKGSALSTIISQFIGSVWILSYFFSKRSTIKLRLKNLIPGKEIVLGMLSIGVSPFVMQIASSIVVLIANRNLAMYGGDLAIAALGIINSIFMIIFMPVIGINQGMQPIVGYNYGAQQYGRVLQTLKKGLFFASAICILGFLVIFIFDEQIVMLFSTQESKLIQMGVHGMRIYFLMLPMLGFMIIAASYFQAVKKAKFAIILTLLRQVIILIPLLLILPHFFRIDGVWVATPIADGISSILAVIFLMMELRKLRGMQAASKEILN